jgi:MOSC domain-containing protein YiiM
MIRIHTLLIGQPQLHTDARGTWRSAIYRTPLAGPVRLEVRGLDGDQVADTDHHGSLNQAVCCQPLAHYAAWNAEYGLTAPDQILGPGSVGENWTLTGVTERDVCIGDIYAVGTARVQVTAPRYPCTKQDRKLELPGFHRRVMETLRTGFYLRVLTPGVVQAGDAWTLEARPHPAITVEQVNANCHRDFDPAFAVELLALPELADGWKGIIRSKLNKAVAV